MSEKFSVLRVDREQAISMESVGSKRKFWFSHNHKRLIFKAEERGTGEDWAEVVSAELCELLGLPHVGYELAQEFVEGAYVFPGVVSERLITWSESLISVTRYFWCKTQTILPLNAAKFVNTLVWLSPMRFGISARLVVRN